MAQGSNIPVSSIGTKISIGLGTEQGVHPRPIEGASAGFKRIPKVRELPELDIEPDTYNTTSFDNLKYKSSMDGLIDTTGVMTLAAIYTELGENLWNEVADAYDLGDKEAWLMIDNPKIKNKYFIPINPIQTGMPTITQEDVVMMNYRFTILGDIEKEEVSADDIQGYYDEVNETVNAAAYSVD